jgi:hypothetical protein
MPSAAAKDFPQLFHDMATKTGIKEMPSPAPVPDFSQGAYSGPNFSFEFVIDYRLANPEMVIRVIRNGETAGREYKLLWNGIWLSGLDGSKRTNEELCSMVVNML